tara:strand:- start:313 stop:480 length:168 start_codon:yes stop_codon:yes gene_type:complete
MEGLITMDKVKEAYTITDNFIDSNFTTTPRSFVLKSIAASFAGALIPAAIFYFLM